MTDDELANYFAGLIARMKMGGERAAFDEFGETIGRMLSVFGPKIFTPSWQELRIRWITKMAIRVARPQFEIPKNFVVWFEKQLTDFADGLARELLAVSDLDERMVSLSLTGDSDLQIGHARRAQFLLSGDFLDICQDGDRTWLILGDSMGHGPAAAYYSKMALATLRSCLFLENGLSAALSQANEILFRHRPGREYLVAQIVGWNASTKKLEIANAGLTVAPAIVSEKGIDKLEIFGPALGWFSKQKYDVLTTEINSGDVLIMTSDGITEQQNALGLEYGYRYLEHTNRIDSSLGSEEVAKRILESVDAFSGGEFDDDQTVVVIRFALERERLAASLLPMTAESATQGLEQPTIPPSWEVEWW